MATAHPFSPPDPRAPTRVLLVAVALAGALCAYPSLADEPLVREQTRGEPWAWWVVAGWTALASVTVLRVQLGAGSLGGALLRGALVGGVLGVLDSGLSLGTILLLRSGDPVQAASGAFMGALFGVFVGGIRGVAFGLGYAPLAWLARRLADRPSHEGRDVALVAGGATILAAIVLRSALIDEQPDLQLAVAGAGLVAATVGLARVRARRAFLARVRRGQLSDWAIDAVPAAGAPRGLFPATLGSADAVLVRAAELGGGPYRAASGWTPVALVSSPSS